MPVSLKDQVVLIVGASSGIGRATAVMMAREGAKVMASARRQERLAQLQREMAAEGRTVEIFARGRQSLEAVEQKVVPIGTEHLGHPGAHSPAPHPALHHAPGNLSELEAEFQVVDVLGLVNHRVGVVLAIDVSKARAKAAPFQIGRDDCGFGQQIRETHFPRWYMIAPLFANRQTE